MFFRSDVREAMRSAVRNMIAFLVAEYGLDRVGAYILCSVAGDLRMHEVVCGRAGLRVEILTTIVRWTCQTMWYVMLCQPCDNADSTGQLFFHRLG